MVDFHRLWALGQGEADRLIRQFADSQRQYIEKDPFDPKTQELVELTVHRYEDALGRTTYSEDPTYFAEWAKEIQDVGNFKGPKMLLAGLALPKPGEPIAPPTQIGEPFLSTGPALFRLAPIIPLAGSLQMFNSELNPLQPKLTHVQKTVYVVLPKRPDQRKIWASPLDPENSRRLFLDWLERVQEFFGEDSPFVLLDENEGQISPYEDQPVIVMSGDSVMPDFSSAKSEEVEDFARDALERGDQEEIARTAKGVADSYKYYTLPVELVFELGKRASNPDLLFYAIMKLPVDITHPIVLDARLNSRALFDAIVLKFNNAVREQTENIQTILENTSLNAQDKQEMLNNYYNQTINIYERTFGLGLVIDLEVGDEFDDAVEAAERAGFRMSVMPADPNTPAEKPPQIERIIIPGDIFSGKYPTVILGRASRFAPPEGVLKFDIAGPEERVISRQQLIFRMNADGVWTVSTGGRGVVLTEFVNKKTGEILVFGYAGNEASQGLSPGRWRVFMRTPEPRPFDKITFIKIGGSPEKAVKGTEIATAEVPLLQFDIVIP